MIRIVAKTVSRITAFVTLHAIPMVSARFAGALTVVQVTVTAAVFLMSVVLLSSVLNSNYYRSNSFFRLEGRGSSETPSVEFTQPTEFQQTLEVRGVTKVAELQVQSIDAQTIWVQNTDLSQLIQLKNLICTRDRRFCT